MVAFPSLIAVTFPSATVATAVLLLLQLMFLFVALSGFTVAFNVNSSPSVICIDVLSRVTLSTGKTLAFTVTSQVAVFPPSSVLTVMVAFPFLIAVTFPSATVAIERLLLLHITSLLSAFLGETVAINCTFSPSSSSTDSALSDTPETATGSGRSFWHDRSTNIGKHNASNLKYFIGNRL